MDSYVCAAKHGRLHDSLSMFALGASVYPVIELAWRGHTHWTMSITGGLCTLFIHWCNRRMGRRSLIAKCGAGCAVITCTEFTVGCIVNRILGWNVWDYSGTPFNILGQICPLYCFFWLVLSLPVLAISSRLELKRHAMDIVFPDCEA